MAALRHCPSAQSQPPTYLRPVTLRGAHCPTLASPRACRSRSDAEAQWIPWSSKQRAGGMRSRLPNKRLQLTPNSSFQSMRGTVLAAGAVPQRWRSALLGAADPLDLVL